MSFRAGEIGQKAEMVDGVKSDVIDELTAGLGVAIKGRTNGAAAAMGNVGEQLSATQGTNVAINTSSAVDVVTLTLTPGMWWVSSQLYWDNTPSQTGVSVYLKIKGSAGAVLGVDQIVHEGVAGTAGHVTFASRLVTITAGDINKNVALNTLSRTASGNARGAIYAVRIA